MLKMGVPRSAVALKMAADGVDPRDVRTFETEGLDDDALEEARRKAGGDVATLFLRLPGRAEGVMGGRGGLRRRRAVRLQAVHWEPLGEERLSKAVFALRRSRAAAAGAAPLLANSDDLIALQARGCCCIPQRGSSSSSAPAQREAS